MIAIQEEDDRDRRGIKVNQFYFLRLVCFFFSSSKLRLNSSIPELVYHDFSSHITQFRAKSQKRALPTTAAELSTDTDVAVASASIKCPHPDCYAVDDDVKQCSQPSLMAHQASTFDAALPIVQSSSSPSPPVVSSSHAAAGAAVVDDDMNGAERKRKTITSQQEPVKKQKLTRNSIAIPIPSAASAAADSLLDVADIILVVLLLAESLGYYPAMPLSAVYAPFYLPLIQNLMLISCYMYLILVKIQKWRRSLMLA